MFMNVRENPDLFIQNNSRYRHYFSEVNCTLLRWMQLTNTRNTSAEATNNAQVEQIVAKSLILEVAGSVWNHCHDVRIKLPLSLNINIRFVTRVEAARTKTSEQHSKIRKKHCWTQLQQSELDFTSANSAFGKMWKSYIFSAAGDEKPHSATLCVHQVDERLYCTGRSTKRSLDFLRWISDQWATVQAISC